MTIQATPTILAPVCLPWTESFALDARAFLNQITQLIDGGIRHLYLFGTAGEGYAVTNQQFESTARIFAQATAGQVETRQLGVIGMSLPQVQEKIEIGRALGVDSFQISFLPWGRLGDSEVEAFFQGTCGRYRDCRFLFYNVPRGLRTLTPSEISAVARRHENLVAVKWALAMTHDELRQLMTCPTSASHFLTDISYCEARLIGVPASLLTALSSSNLRIAREIFELGQRRDDDERLRMRRAELHVHRDIVHRLANGDRRIDGAFDKLYCRLRDPAFPLRLLPPYEGFSDEEFNRYRAELRSKLPDYLRP